MKAPTALAVLVPLLPLALTWPCAGSDRVVYPGGDGPGRGKRIVLISGDDEYRSEEALPMLGMILSRRHGFHCTVLFPIGSDGTIDPGARDNIPGMEALETADLCILALRFRELKDAQMSHFVRYLNHGRPIIALRTSTHAFAYATDSGSPYARYGYRSKDWPGGFGRQVLGETWVSHHGAHGKESTRGVIDEAAREHPVLRGVDEIWGPSDVYTVTALPADAVVLVRGQVLEGMRPGDPPVNGPKNNPMMPIVWSREHRGESGKTLKTLTTTMGAAVDLENEGLRHLLVNACYWLLGLEDRLPARADVEYVGGYRPTWFGFGAHRKGVRPSDFEDRK